MPHDTENQLLLVEDDSSIKALLTLMLEAQGFTVIPFPDAESAWAYLQLCPNIGLLITDYQLSGKSGDTLIRDLQGLSRSIPAILISGHLNIATIANTCGADGHFLKGEPIGHLVEIAQKLWKRPLNEDPVAGTIPNDRVLP